MRRAILGFIVLGLTCSAAQAQTGKGIRFWNLTANTVKEFYLSPAGKDEWVQTTARTTRMARLTTVSA